MELYKYLSRDRAIRMLEDNKLIFSLATHFNDPFELNPYFIGLAPDEFVDNQLKYFPSQIHKEVNEILKEKINTEGMKKFKEITLSKLGILCLSSDYKNLLMWAHYADSHKGCVIKFDAESEFFNRQKSNQDNLRKITQVIYQKERPNLYITDLDNSIESLLSTKDEIWEYESEKRMILSVDELTELEAKKGIYYDTFDPKIIKSIYCGVNMKLADRIDLYGKIKSNSQLNHIKVYGLELDKKEFKLSEKLFD